MNQYNFEPAARIITAIGKDLIKDVPASIVELVKNSYDADATNVNITFKKNNRKLIVIIGDDGHGMDKDTILNSWLVPGTNHKLINKKSPNNRPYQGRKGIGRYAAAILGNELKLESVKDGVLTSAVIDWEDFERKKYLKDVKITIDTFNTELPNGTTLTITGGQEYLEILGEKEIEEITKELRKLISPLKGNSNENSRDKFNINIRFDDFYEDEHKNRYIDIEPFPILEMYNYRLSGTIYKDGKAKLVYENAYKQPIDTVLIKKQFNLKSEESFSGNIKIDFRVFDKDDEGIDFLQNRMEEFINDGIGKRFIKQLLKDTSGVGIYRNGFRIRPHGDPGFDWLNLDNRRVQNPSQKIGSDSIAGFVDIESEELSGLEEKSARDGLKESSHFRGLKSLILQALTQLEQRRFAYRQERIKQLRGQSSTFNQVDTLFDLSEFEDEIKESINLGINKIKSNPSKLEEYAADIKNSIEQRIMKLEKEKNKEYKQIKEIIAIYQGQATLGKIISVILHEGRKSLGWFSNQIPRTIKWLQKLSNEEQIQNPLYEKILSRLKTTETEALSLTNLFNKLDPLTVTRRSSPKDINLEELINHVYLIFEQELKYNNIDLVITVDGIPTTRGIKEDYLMCLTNLMENSIYWLKNSNIQDKQIKISLESQEKKIMIDFIDNGPGIEKEYIINESIFIPGFSGKSDNSGTGLGLAIAGEAITRNSGRLKAIYSDKGAHFRIEINRDK